MFQFISDGPGATGVAYSIRLYFRRTCSWHASCTTSSLSRQQIAHFQTASRSDTFSSDNAGASSTSKDISVLVPYVDLITRPGRRNRHARRNRSPSPVVETPDISPYKRRKFKKNDSGEKLSSKVYNFFLSHYQCWTDVSANSDGHWATDITYSIRVYFRRT